MDDWIVKLRQFQRRTGIRDPKLDLELKAYAEGAASFGRLWFDKPEVTSTVSSQEFRRQCTGSWEEWPHENTPWQKIPSVKTWRNSAGWPLEVEYEEEPRFDKIGYQFDKWRREMSKPSEGIPTRGFGKITGISKWEKQSREDRYRHEVMSKVEVVHSGISAHLNFALWADDFQYGTSFRERLLQYCGKLLFCIRRLW